MTMLDYIADQDPQGAMDVINNFGYSVDGVNCVEDLASCLHDLVDSEGEEAVIALARLHPDKDLIIEANTAGTVSKSMSKQTNGQGFCGCKSCGKFANKTGLSDIFPANPATLLIISGTILLTAAIILKS